MQFAAFIVSALSLACLVAATPFASESLCIGEEVVTSTSFIGKDNNVKVETISCTLTEPTAIQNEALLDARQLEPGLNVCGTSCTTNCFLPAGGGPDPNDCHVIADALRYASQNPANAFTIGTSANNTIAMSFSSCKTFFLNQYTSSLSYCRTDWASVIDWVAPNCQTAQNAHGGNCVANDGKWFVQVQHV
ncbi:hypothetical protein B0H34DRAFT_778694 [Crassisporium funariophilum]|nr:hypothetical protein B0H34DRAFT_778694 [Crassisporium funariophilum]